MLTFQKVEPGEKKEERGRGGGEYRRSSPSGLHQKPKALDQPLLVHSSRVPGHSCLGIDQPTQPTKQPNKQSRGKNQPTNQTRKNRPNREPTRQPTNQGQKQWINPCSCNPRAWVPRIHCPCINLSCKSLLQIQIWRRDFAIADTNVLANCSYMSSDQMHQEGGEVLKLPGCHVAK